MVEEKSFLEKKDKKILPFLSLSAFQCALGLSCVCGQLPWAAKERECQSISSTGLSYPRNTHLEDLDLAGGAVHQFRAAVAFPRVCLHLDTEWNAFLSSMLLSREFSTDAVHTDVDAGIFGRVPWELDTIQSTFVCAYVQKTIGQRHIWLRTDKDSVKRGVGAFRRTNGKRGRDRRTHVKDALAWPVLTPRLNLLMLHVLQSPLMEQHSDCALQRQRGDHRSVNDLDPRECPANTSHGKCWPCQGKIKGIICSTEQTQPGCELFWSRKRMIKTAFWMIDTCLQELDRTHSRTC